MLRACLLSMRYSWGICLGNCESAFKNVENDFRDSFRGFCNCGFGAVCRNDCWIGLNCWESGGEIECKRKYGWGSCCNVGCESNCCLGKCCTNAFEDVCGKGCERGCWGGCEGCDKQLACWARNIVERRGFLEVAQGEKADPASITTLLNSLPPVEYNYGYTYFIILYLHL